MARTATKPRAAPEPSFRAPERQRLASAIRKRDETLAELDKLRQAQARAVEFRLAAREAIESSESLIRETKEKAPRLYVSRLLSGDANLAPGDDLVAQAETKLASAQRRLQLAIQADQAIGELIPPAEREVAMTRDAVTEAIGSVLEFSASVDAALAAFEGVMAATASMRAVVSLVWHARGLAPKLRKSMEWVAVDDPRDIMAKWPRDDALIARWQSAIRALEKDPDAPLPGDTDGDVRIIPDAGAEAAD